MKFTDDDLKQLKENGPEWELPTYERLMALLARLESAEAEREQIRVRLEAAEKFITHYAFDHDACWVDCPELKAWRKAAGK